MFRFSIRELMLVTLVVGLVASWWLDHCAQVNTGEEWKDYAACLERFITHDGYEIRRGREWVSATRTGPSFTGEGSPSATCCW